MKSLRTLKADVVKERADEKRNEQIALKAKEKNDLRYVSKNKDRLLTEAFKDFDWIIKEALGHKENSTCFTIYNHWNEAGDWLATEGIKLLKLAGYRAVIHKAQHNIKYTDESDEVTIYTTYVKVLLK